MGTTVTTNLALIKPDTSESIKQNLPTFAGWASQNASNCDAIDAVFRTTEHTGVMNWLAATVNPTLGAGGFVEVKYLRAFPRMVIGFFRIFTGGAGFAAGTGVYRLSLPTGIATEFTTFNDHATVGKAILLDADAVLTSSIFTVEYVQATASLTLRPDNGGSWAPTVPITIAQNDRISGYFMYPTSDA